MNGTILLFFACIQKFVSQKAISPISFACSAHHRILIMKDVLLFHICSILFMEPLQLTFKIAIKTSLLYSLWQFFCSLGHQSRYFCQSRQHVTNIYYYFIYIPSFHCKGRLKYHKRKATRDKGEWNASCQIDTWNSDAVQWALWPEINIFFHFFRILQ